MSDMLLTEHHLEFLSLAGGCTGSCESTLVKMSHCWKSHAVAHLFCYCFITGQFGSPGIHVGALVTFLLSTISSIIDSVGDYYACAKMVLAPPPPKHAINRGIAIEGMMSLIGGSAGTSHATSTFASNIGAMGITRVLSHINLLLSPSRCFHRLLQTLQIVYQLLNSCCVRLKLWSC